MMRTTPNPDYVPFDYSVLDDDGETIEFAVDDAIRAILGDVPEPTPMPAELVAYLEEAWA